jgi:O-antigen ligase
MPVRLQNERRSLLFFAALSLMLLSAFISRASLSASVILFVAVSLFHREHTRQWQVFTRSPVLWSMTLLFIIPFISGLWSGDKQAWLEVMQVKMPLLVLPFAFAYPFSLERSRWQWVVIIALSLLTLSSLWSFGDYLFQTGEVDQSYLRGKTLRTVFGNDRVRFSWAVALAIHGAAWVAWIFRRQRAACLLFLSVACWLCFYLHVLAVRTGLLVFYLLSAMILVELFRRRMRLAWFVLSLVLVLPLVAWFSFPTVQNRLKYLRYEIDFALNGSYQRGSTDPVRLISIRSGVKQFATAPLTGSGFGDVAAESEKWYFLHYPDMLPSDRILPSSEFVMYGAGAGIPGLLIFCLVMMVPFFVKGSHRKILTLLQICVIISFLPDIGLEVQYGVFLYCFTLLCTWKWLVNENSQSLQE